MNTFQRATLGNFPSCLGRAGFYHPLSLEQLCRGNERRCENQLLPASNITPNSSLDRFPVSQEGQAEEKFLFLTTQPPFSLPFPKEAFGLLLPTLPPPRLLLNSSLVPWESKANIKRALMYSSCQRTTQHQMSLALRFGLCYNE